MFTTTTELPVTEPLEARTTVIPVATAVTVPAPPTVATLGSSTVNVGVMAVIGLSNGSLPVVESWAVSAALDIFTVSGATLSFARDAAVTVAANVAVPTPVTTALAVCVPAVFDVVH